MLPFPVDYSFISMKRTTVTMVTLVVEAIIAIFLSCEMSLKFFFYLPAESIRQILLLPLSYKEKQLVDVH